MKPFERLLPLVGTERAFTDLHRELRYFVNDIGPAIVGALLVTCADETEHECADAFQRGIVQNLLPRLKYGERAAFRIATLGGKYQWGAGPIAEEHFAAPETESAFKLMVIKINAHVAVDPSGKEPVYGTLRRYNRDANVCSALHALLEGGTMPVLARLRDDLESEGVDRLGILQDPERVDPSLRALFAAMVSARLQARNATLDAQDHKPTTPTVYLVIPCVTLNRPGRDSELVVGVYWIDRRDPVGPDFYHGLADDPSAYEVIRPQSPLTVKDPGSSVTRKARDHRQLVLERFQQQGPPLKIRHAKWDEIREATRTGHHTKGANARILLRGALETAAAMNPISAAVLLFAHGATSIHHAHKMHRVAREVQQDDTARHILEEVQSTIEQLPPERARELLELLVNAH